ncbi:hypothetical protein LXL04_017660 [Taraxacum kok-saghyz]
MTPFQALYGRPVPTILHYTSGSSKVASIDTSLLELQRLRQLLKDTLTRTRQRMTDNANRKRIDKEFQVGDKVFLKLHHYRQQSVARRTSNKLSKRYYGPFSITERIGPVAYRLDLPPHSKIHPVFHISLLKQAFGDHPSGTAQIPALLDHTFQPLQPTSVLDKRTSQTGEQEALIQWQHRQIAEATWETNANLAQHFPNFMQTNNLELEDELSSEQEGIDTSPGQLSPKDPPMQSTSRPKRTIKVPNKFRD